MNTATTSDSTISHVRALDGMRGVAILAVVCFHFGYLGVGWAGVQMFFVLSGFLITSILLAERDYPFSFYVKRFYWRRALRIFPLYFAFVGVIAIAALSYGAPAFRQQWPYLLTYTFNYARLLPDYIGPRYWGHLWSLSVEEQFYLVWPTLIFFLPRRTLGWALVGLIVATPLLRLAIEMSLPARILEHPVGYLSYFLTICQLDAFASGALVACLHGIGRIRRPVRLWLFVSVLTLGIGIANQLTTSDAARFRTLTLGYPIFLASHYQSSWGYTVLNVWSATLLMVALQKNAISRFFRFGPLAHVGKISYGVYVFHFPVLALMQQQLHWPFGSRSAGGLAVFAVYLALTLAVSQISYVAFERRFLALKNRRFVRPAEEDRPSIVLAAS
jgi:peptidoglycan/LPS O-acetylase OafA/YrhL